MKRVVKMVLTASYESAAGVSLEKSSRSFWPPIARRAAFFLNDSIGLISDTFKVDAAFEVFKLLSLTSFYLYAVI